MHQAPLVKKTFSQEAATEQFLRLLRIMDELREQCPWDKKQTFESLRHLTIEETYELADALLDRNLPEVKNELGDVLLHLVFYARLGSEEAKDAFHIVDVMEALCEKLVRRHPHIYGDVKAQDEEAVKTLWEQVKGQEQGFKGVLSGVPASLPAMVKAFRIQAKARGAGFDWEEKEQVWEKVKEELEEFHRELEKGPENKSEMEAEFGDVLFSLVNYARQHGINPEDALERTNKKFIRRFNYLEAASKADGKSLGQMSLQEMDRYWEQAKASEKSTKQNSEKKY